MKRTGVLGRYVRSSLWPHTKSDAGKAGAKRNLPALRALASAHQHHKTCRPFPEEGGCGGYQASAQIDENQANDLSQKKNRQARPRTKAARYFQLPLFLIPAFFSFFLYFTRPRGKQTSQSQNCPRPNPTGLAFKKAAECPVARTWWRRGLWRAAVFFCAAHVIEPGGEERKR